MERGLGLGGMHIATYCSFLNSPERLEQIRQVNKLASVLCDLESDRIRDKEEKKKKVTEVEDNRRQKSEEKQIRENEDKLRGLEIFEALVRSVLTFVMDHINTLKVKDLRLLLRYHSGSERLKGTPKKVELVEAVTDLFRRDWESLMHRVGGVGSVVTNEIGEKEIFLV